MDIVTDGYRMILRFNDRQVELTREEWEELREEMTRRMMEMLLLAAQTWKS